MKYKSPNDCADCEWLANETDGEWTQCDECAFEEQQEQKEKDAS